MLFGVFDRDPGLPRSPERDLCGTPASHWATMPWRRSRDSAQRRKRTPFSILPD